IRIRVVRGDGVGAGDVGGENFVTDQPVQCWNKLRRRYRIADPAGDVCVSAGGRPERDFRARLAIIIDSRIQRMRAHKNSTTASNYSFASCAERPGKTDPRLKVIVVTIIKTVAGTVRAETVA